MSDYFQPTTLDDALEIKANNDVQVLAGGTDIYPARAGAACWGGLDERPVLDLSRITGLRGIEEQGDHWRIGATTTWTDLISAVLPPLFDGYRAAAREVGGAQIQNRGTLAGNLCTASPAGDGIPNLMAIDASIVVHNAQGMRIVPVGDFITGYRKTVLACDELLTAIMIPKPQNKAKSAFVKLGARRYLVISIVMVSGMIEIDAKGVIEAARVAVGACSPNAVRLAELEARLIGNSPMEDLSALVTPDDVAGLQPIDDPRASAAYRNEAAEAALRDLLTRLTKQSEAKAA